MTLAWSSWKLTVRRFQFTALLCLNISHTISDSEINSQTPVASLTALGFSVLSIADGYATDLGLSRGLRESEMLATYMVTSFGPGAFFFKVAVAVLVVAVADMGFEYIE